MHRIPVISDTHGLLRPAVADALSGASLILHAGDVGKPATLEALRAIAPVRAIRGNVDRGDWADVLPEADTVDLAGRRIHLVHDRADLGLDPTTAGIDVVVFGHSHRASEERVGGVLWLNPGSVGPRRFRLPITMAWLTLDSSGAVPVVEFAAFDP